MTVRIREDEAGRGSAVRLTEPAWWPSYRGTFHAVQRERGRVHGIAYCGVLLYRPTRELAGLRKCRRCLADVAALHNRERKATDVRL